MPKGKKSRFLVEFEGKLVSIEAANFREALESLGIKPRERSFYLENLLDSAGMYSKEMFSSDPESVDKLPCRKRTISNSLYRLRWETQGVKSTFTVEFGGMYFRTNDIRKAIKYLIEQSCYLDGLLEEFIWRDFYRHLKMYFDTMVLTHPQATDKDRNIAAFELAWKMRPHFVKPRTREAFKKLYDDSVEAWVLQKRRLAGFFLLAKSEIYEPHLIRWGRKWEKGVDGRKKSVRPAELPLVPLTCWLFLRVRQLYEEWLFEEAFGTSSLDSLEKESVDEDNPHKDKPKVDPIETLECKLPSCLDELIAAESSRDSQIFALSLLKRPELSAQESQFVSNLFMIFFKQSRY